MVEVVYAHQDGNITGSAISLHNLLTALDRDKFSPRVALFSDGPARNLYEAIDIPVDVVSARPFWTFPGSAWTELGYYYNFLALLPNGNWSQYLKKRKPDLVHVNDKSCLQAGVAAHYLNVPVVWHLRSSCAPSRSQLQAKISTHVIRKNSNAMIAISEDEIDGYEDCRNLHIIHNSLDFSKVEDAVHSRPRIRTELGISAGDVAVGLVVTKLNWVRGAWDFLNIAGLVTKMARAPLRFVIVGSITEESAMNARTLAQRYGISDRLILTGFRSDALAIIAALDVLVVCNHHGVMGRPPFEAMAVSTPVTAWHGHSLRSSVVIDGETALLVPRGNSEALAQAITRLVNDPSLRRAMGMCGARYAREQFDNQRNTRAVQLVYQEILPKKKKAI